MRGVKRKTNQQLFWQLILIIALTACTKLNPNGPEVMESPVADLATEVSVTPTLPEPTMTPLPAVAIVNGERISLIGFEREVERYLIAQEALGVEDPDQADARETVLNDLIDQVLLAQGAREAGIEFSDAEVQARLEQLAEEVDLDGWMAAWGYTQDELFESLHLQMLVANQHERIADTIPEAVDQVELRQVLALTAEGAKRALGKLNADAPFEEVAFEFSPETGGYLGWVPRGYLLIPIVEEAVFDLTVGSYTDIIESEIGYHIVLVIDREVRPLSADARITLTRQALFDWLDEHRATSVIEVLID
jgi:peptidyl-prolyl cis-trans isomerase C